jgi:hypothetical protein
VLRHYGSIGGPGPCAPPFGSASASASAGLRKTVGDGALVMLSCVVVMHSLRSGLSISSE